MIYWIKWQTREIRRSDLLIQPGTHLGKNLRLIFMVPADFLILPDHPVMPSNNHDAHRIPPSAVSFHTALIMISTVLPSWLVLINS